MPDPLRPTRATTSPHRSQSTHPPARGGRRGRPTRPRTRTAMSEANERRTRRTSGRCASCPRSRCPSCGRSRAHRRAVQGTARAVPAAQPVSGAATGIVDLTGLGQRAIFMQLAQECGASRHERRQRSRAPTRVGSCQVTPPPNHVLLRAARPATRCDGASASPADRDADVRLREGDAELRPPAVRVTAKPTRTSGELADVDARLRREQRERRRRRAGAVAAQAARSASPMSYPPDQTTPAPTVT